MNQYLFIFDMGGVVSEHCFVWKHICEAMNLSEEAALAASCCRLEQATLRGDITSMEMLSLVSARTKKPPVPENYWQTFFEPRLNTETVALIQDLRAAGARVVCGSNTIDAHYAYHVAHGQYACFDAVYASHLMGQAKPDAAFWQYIQEAETREGHEYAAGDIFFFDDMAENVCAASRLGIRAHQFTTAADARAFIQGETGAAVAHAGSAV